jgi:hypothetical protein
MRADLRTDLKDSGSLWSDAELNRAIEKAVSDLSRYLPRSRLYEEVLEFGVTGESVTFPVDTDPDRIVDAQTFNGKSAGNTFTIAAQPDVPRALTLLVTDADGSMTDWHIRIDGTDEDDMGVSEDFYFGNGLSQTGKQVFKRVHAVTLVETFGGTAVAGDVLDIGVGAYTDVWVKLANKPVKYSSDSATDAGSNTLARNTDYSIDYARGMVKAVSGGDIAAGEVCTFAYTKNQTHIDLSALDDFIRAYRVEYPVGDIPQTFCSFELYGRYLSITGSGESEPQPTLQEHKHVRVYYDATHHPPSDFSPGTVPEFLENTVVMAAAAYALLTYSLKCEHQALVDIATARASVISADAVHTDIEANLAVVGGYLDDGSSALGLCASLHSAIIAALDAASVFLDAVATDLTNADNVRADYITTTNYVDGGSEPDIKTYLASGGNLLNTITKGGENERTPEMYAMYARAVKDALVGAFELDRQLYQQNATARTNAALAFVQEASQRIQDIQANIAEAEGYNSIAATMVRGIEAQLQQIASYLSSAAHSIEIASNDLSMADKFRTESDIRFSEVYNIWRDRKQYIGDFAASSMRQILTGG